MPAAARYVRALVLIVVALMAAGGESLVLPVAHLFADHDHEIVFSAASSTWQWVAPDDHHGQPAMDTEHHGHSEHEPVVATTAVRFGKTAGLSLALTPTAILGTDHARQGASCRDWPDLAPDIGKPDLALLATMRV